MFAHVGHEIGDNSRLGAHIHMKTGRCSRPTLALTEIEVMIAARQGIEYEPPLPFRGTFPRIALDGEDGVVVEAGYGLRFAGKEVVVDMAAPLGHNLRSRARRPAVENRYNRIVGTARAAADVDAHEILSSLARTAPEREQPVGRGDEARSVGHADVAETRGCDFAPLPLLAAIGPQSLHIRAAEHTARGGGEGLRGSGGIFRHHRAVVRKAEALVVIPLYSLQRAAVEFPQLPLVGIKRVPELAHTAGEPAAVDFYFMPGHEEGYLVALTRSVGPEPLAVEEVAHTVGRALHCDERQRLCGYSRGHRAQ